MTTQDLTLSRLNSASMIVKHVFFFFYFCLFIKQDSDEKTGQLLMKLKCIQYNNLTNVPLIDACCLLLVASMPLTLSERITSTLDYNIFYFSACFAYAVMSICKGIIYIICVE